MRPILYFSSLLIAGLAIVGGAAFVTARSLAGKPLITFERPPILVATGPLDAPLVAPDGRLLGYVRFDAQLSVPAHDAERLRTNLPMLLDAINQRSFSAPIAGGTDGLVPQLDQIRAVVLHAAHDAFATVQVGKVALTDVEVNLQ